MSVDSSAVAALEALALRRCLDRGRRHLARRFFAAADEVVTDAWQLAVNADLALPEVFGRRTPSGRFPNGYVGRVLATAEHDDMVARQFMRMTGMLNSPAYLFRPRAQTWSVVRRWRCLGLIETLGNRLPGSGV